MMIGRTTAVGCVQIVNKADGEYSGTDISLCKLFAGIIAMIVNEKNFTFSPTVDKKVIMSFRNVVKDYPSGT